MDRFKFRIYDIKLKMYYSDGRYINGNQYMDSYFEDVYDLTDDMIVEQCTGLKDKNGNLIYEGDIVRFCVKRRGYILTYERIIAWDKDKCSFVVRNAENQAAPLAKWKMPHPDTHIIEIIGNIHNQKDNK
jgi:uncharacterized phage protein (TIGR01671 family)